MSDVNMLPLPRIPLLSQLPGIRGLRYNDHDCFHGVVDGCWERTAADLLGHAVASHVRSFGCVQSEQNYNPYIQPYFIHPSISNAGSWCLAACKRCLPPLCTHALYLLFVGKSPFTSGKKHFQTSTSNSVAFHKSIVTSRQNKMC